MADYVTDDLEYWLAINKDFREAVYVLRKWPNLKIAVDGSLIWIRGLSLEEIESATVLSIPSIRRYYLKKAQLVPYGKKLPAMIEPSLLWSPIHRGLKVSLPKENFNYFGLDQQYKISIIPSDKIRTIDTTIVDLNKLERYIRTASSVRLKKLKWTILDNQRALIIGTPMLPIEGQDLYQNLCFLIPAGWRLEYENMASTYKRALGESIEYWYLMNRNGITKVSKANFSQLSKGSFIKSLA